MPLPVVGYVQQVEVVVGGTLPRAGYVQPVESSGGAGLVTGSGAAGQVTFWTGAQTVSGSNSLFWDSTDLQLKILGTVNPQLKLLYDATHFISTQVSASGNVTEVIQGGALLSFSVPVPAASPLGGTVEVLVPGTSTTYCSFDCSDAFGRRGSLFYGGDHGAGDKSFGIINRGSDYLSIYGGVTQAAAVSPIWFFINGVKVASYTATGKNYVFQSDNPISDLTETTTGNSRTLRLSVDNTNSFTYIDSTFGNVSAYPLSLRTAGVEFARGAAGVLNVPTALSTGATPAAAGAIRMTDALVISWPSGVNYIGFRSSSGTVDFEGGTAYATAINIRISASNGIALSSSGLQLQGDAAGKLGYFAAAPVVRQTAAGVTAGYTANVTANFVYDATTFTGNTGATAYTIGDVVAALKNYGLLTS